MFACLTNDLSKYELSQPLPRGPGSSRDNHTAEMEIIGDFEVKELSRRASGQAFEVILSPSSANGKGKLLQSPLKKKETSLDDIKKKLDAAEERRKSQGAEVMKVLAEQAEHRKEVVQKAISETCNFSSSTQEKINQKMEATKESRNAQMAALTEKFKARDKKLEDAKKLRQ